MPVLSDSSRLYSKYLGVGLAMSCKDVGNYSICLRYYFSMGTLIWKEAQILSQSSDFYVHHRLSIALWLEHSENKHKVGGAIPGFSTKHFIIDQDITSNN